MADYDATDTTLKLSDTDTDSSEDESEEEQVETLVAGRERRKTAGNRYDRDMVLEEVAAVDEDADEVTLLFADNEDEEDEEFKSSEEEEDADLSSSDDDDQGPNAAVDDLDGEKELEKQAKQERAKKRRADLALTSVAGLRKKLKTDPTRPAALLSQAKPSKKKERVTWVHDPDSGRSSLRKQTIAHRAETIARLKESEAQSKKLKALKEQRDRERAKDAPKELTQADRLAEAARIEKQNAKSLNRWETMEKKRQEEQAAKLAALKNRKLEGPVISWWSARATWIGPKLSKIGTKDAGDVKEGGVETKKRGRKSKAFLEQQAAVKEAERGTPLPQNMSVDTPVSTQVTAPAPAAAPAAAPAVPSSTSIEREEPLQDKKSDATPAPEIDQPQIPLAAPQQEDTFLKGIHEYATLEEDSNAMVDNPVSAPPQDLNAQQARDQNLEEQPKSGDLSNLATSRSIQTEETKQTEQTEQTKQTESEPDQTPPDLILKAKTSQSAQSVHPPKTEGPPMTVSTAEKGSSAPEPLLEVGIPSATEPRSAPEHLPTTGPSLGTEPPSAPEPSSTTGPPLIKELPSAPEPSSTTEPPLITELPSAPEPSSTTGPPLIKELPSAPEPSSTTGPPLITELPSAPEPSSTTEPPLITELPSAPEPSSTTEPPLGTEPHLTSAVASAPEPEPVVESSTRNIVILERFEELSPESRQEYSFFFNTRKAPKLVKHSQELCPITTLPVRYRDTSTGIGFANVVGYKKLQELKQHRFAWSSMLGCYVGRDDGVVARGVPEGFVDK
ncbi:hypothetical protein A1O3_01616 [Capronia epimyces CBS 606.96]|uniref:Vps72/YL1 C-terminal domain-containing protein n=1 Tax=Capronia epimyces CBS 606.96 TaxID=1182542 RepID=W9YTR3_9EURO|nr:uncharacterized protein A1O3_01616 [Capronia epimyces CBS 606.96]EXJ93060.1 hypothetical protein A1O3_01616 [Capronia epimyces CBS 606.96]